MRTICISISISIMILFLLTACAAGAPTSQTSEFSSEAQVTVTLTASATPPPTFTPTPVFPPEFLSLGLDPNQYKFSADGTQILGKADGMVTMVKGLDGKFVEPITFAPEIVENIKTKLPSGAELWGNLIITNGYVFPYNVIVSGDGKDWAIQDTYEFGDNKSFTEKISFRGVLPDGKWDFEGHTYDPVTGETQQKQMIHEGQKIDAPLYSMSQMIEIIRQASRRAMIDGVIPPELRDESNMIRLLGLTGTENDIMYMGMKFRIGYTSTNGNIWSDSYIYVWNPEKGFYEKEATIVYAYTSVGEGGVGTYGYVALEEDGEIKGYFVDQPNINIHQKSTEYRKRGVGSPFWIDG